MAVPSFLTDVPGLAVVGLVPLVYILLVSIAALAAIFARRKVRRDTALAVLKMLLPGRRNRQ